MTAEALSAAEADVSPQAAADDGSPRSVTDGDAAPALAEARQSVVDVVAARVGQVTDPDGTGANGAHPAGPPPLDGHPAHPDDPPDEVAAAATPPAAPVVMPPGEAPAGEIPTPEAPPTVVLAAEAPTAEVPPAEVPPAGSPAAEVPTGPVPPAEAPTAGVPPAEVPSAGSPAAEVPTGPVLPAEAPTAEVPPAELPPAGSPAAEVPTGPVLPAEAPTAEAPPAELPPAGSPAAEVPTGPVPPAEAPTAEAPPAESPAAEVLPAGSPAEVLAGGLLAGEAPGDAAAEVEAVLRPDGDPGRFAASAVLDVLRASGWADADEAQRLRAEADRLRELLDLVVRDHRAREASAAGLESQQHHWLIPLLRAAHGVAFGSLGAKVALRTAVQDVPEQILASAGLRIDYGVEPNGEAYEER